MSHQAAVVYRCDLHTLHTFHAVCSAVAKSQEIWLQLLKPNVKISVLFWRVYILPEKIYSPFLYTCAAFVKLCRCLIWHLCFELSFSCQSWYMTRMTRRAAERAKRLAAAPVSSLTSGAAESEGNIFHLNLLHWFSISPFVWTCKLSEAL